MYRKNKKNESREEVLKRVFGLRIIINISEVNVNLTGKIKDEDSLRLPHIIGKGEAHHYDDNVEILTMVRAL